MVSLNENNLTIKALNAFWYIIVSCLPNHIAEDIYKATFVNLVIPSADAFGSHFFDCFEWATIELEDVLISKAQVTRK